MAAHTIGDCLYALGDCEPLNGTLAEEVVTYPVIRVTEQDVYVYGRLVADEGGLFRLSRAELENEGCTYSRPLRALLHTRPGVDWPLIVVSVTKGPRVGALDHAAATRC